MPSKAFQMRPNSVGVLYTFQQISIHIHGPNHKIVYPSRKISILLGEGSHLDEYSSEHSGNCNWRWQHIASWGHGLSVKNHWKAYHIILKGFSSCMCSTKIWPKTSDSTENSAPEFTKEIRQSCIQWQQCRQNHQIRW